MLPLNGTCVWCDGRKGNTTQNVMFACDLRACLDWLVNCWLQWYLVCVNVKVLYDKFIYFIGKYYLIDSRYPMIKGYLQPYKGANTPSCRYLTKKQRTRGSRGIQENFIKLHHKGSSHSLVILASFVVPHVCGLNLLSHYST